MVHSALLRTSVALLVPKGIREVMDGRFPNLLLGVESSLLDRGLGGTHSPLLLIHGLQRVHGCFPAWMASSRVSYLTR